MYLSERKTKILEAIINDYIVTAEPIGSRTIAKRYELGVSSATIRNEMSDLEEMGLIIQPHASAGRVPSDKGYRLYVDNLMRKHELTREETAFLQSLVIDNINQIEYLMKETAKAVSLLTSYTTVVSEPKADKSRIRHMQLIPIDETTILLVLVLKSKAIKNQTIKVPNAPDAVVLTKISIVLNRKISDIDISSINQEFVSELEDELGEYRYMARLVIDCIVNVATYEDDIQVYTSGVKNILTFPEFSDLNKAKAIFHTLEEKKMLITLLDSNANENIQIIIGKENNIENMQECSVIKANYFISGQNYGCIGIIGPTRMDYPQVVAVLNGIVQNINEIINNLR